MPRLRESSPREHVHRRVDRRRQTAGDVAARDRVGAAAPVGRHRLGDISAETLVRRLHRGRPDTAGNAAGNRAAPSPGASGGDVSAGTRPSPGATTAARSTCSASRSRLHSGAPGAAQRPGTFPRKRRRPRPIARTRHRRQHRAETCRAPSPGAKRRRRFRGSASVPGCHDGGPVHRQRFTIAPPLRRTRHGAASGDVSAETHARLPSPQARPPTRPPRKSALLPAAHARVGSASAGSGVTLSTCAPLGFGRAAAGIAADSAAG